MGKNDDKTPKQPRKSFKRPLIIAGCVLAFVVILVAFTPLALQSYINSEAGGQKVNDILGEYFDAQLELGKTNLTVWGDFPDAKIEIVNSSIISNAITDNNSDTLLKFDTLRLSVNLWKLLVSDSIIVNEALLSHPVVNTYTTPQGKGNWDVIKTDTTPSDTTSFGSIVKVKRLQTKDLQANYRDGKSLALASLDSTDIEISGNISADILNLATKIKINADFENGPTKKSAQLQPSEIKLNGNFEKGEYGLTVTLGQIAAKFIDSTSRTKLVVDTVGVNASAILNGGHYNLDANLNVLLSKLSDPSMSLRDIPLELNLKGKADTSLRQFDINTLKLNCSDIFVDASGWMQNMADSSWNTDISVSLDIPRIEKAMKIIPSGFATELNKYSLSGAAKLNGKISGTYKDDKYPDLDATLSLTDVNAVVLEKNAEIKIDLETDVRYDSEKQSASFINIRQLNATVGNNYIDLKGKASNVFNDPYIDAKLKCNLNLNYLSTLFPINDLTYKGKLSSDIKARFSIDNLLKLNMSKIYLLGNINIDSIRLRVPSKRFFIFGKNAKTDVGINSLTMRRSNEIQLGKAMFRVDTLRVMIPHVLEARVSKFNLNAHKNKPVNEVPVFGVMSNINGLQAIVSDTMFVQGKNGNIRLSVRPDIADTLIPALKGSVKLDSIRFYKPSAGSFIDSTEIVLNVKPRLRRFKRVNGELVRLDQSNRTSMNTDSLVRLCKSVHDFENALRRFCFDGNVHAKAVRFMSPYLDLKMGTRRLDMSFTDDTLFLNNMMLRMGRSIVRINGRVDNMRRALLRGRTLGAGLNITSRNIDFNEILYAKYIGDQKRQADNDALKAAKKKNPRANTNLGPARNTNVGDSASARIADSTRRAAYRKKDLGEIYKERMGRMKELIDRAYSEELANADNLDTQDTTETEYDTVPMSLIKIPGNLDCKVNMKIDTVRFAGFKFNHLKSDITAQNSILSIKDMTANSNVGELSLNAMYQCDNPDSAKAGIDLKGTNITVENLLKAVPSIDSILPMLSSFKGNLDCELSAITTLNDKIEPILPSLQTACHIRGNDLVLLDGETFTTIAKYLLFKKKTKNVIDNMSVDFTIDKNVLKVYPFILSMDKYKVAVSGNMNFDFKYFFHISVLEPKALLIPLGINVQSKESVKNKGKGNKDDDGELLEESNEFQYRLVKPLYKDENSVASTTNIERISIQQNLRKTIQGIIESYDKKKGQ